MVALLIILMIRPVWSPAHIEQIRRIKQPVWIEIIQCISPRTYKILPDQVFVIINYMHKKRMRLWTRKMSILVDFHQCRQKND